MGRTNFLEIFDFFLILKHMFDLLESSYKFQINIDANDKLWK